MGYYPLTISLKNHNWPVIKCLASLSLECKLCPPSSSPLSWLWPTLSLARITSVLPDQILASIVTILMSSNWRTEYLNDISDHVTALPKIFHLYVKTKPNKNPLLKERTSLFTLQFCFLQSPSFFYPFPHALETITLFLFAQTQFVISGPMVLSAINSIPPVPNYLKNA